MRRTFQVRFDLSSPSYGASAFSPFAPISEAEPHLAAAQLEAAATLLPFRGERLAGIQLDHQLLVHDRSNFFASRYPHHLALELILVDHQPIWNRLNLR